MIEVSDPFALRWRFKPRGDPGLAWDACADSADIPNAPPASEASEELRQRMQQSGVVGQPDIDFLEEVESTSA